MRIILTAFFAGVLALSGGHVHAVSVDKGEIVESCRDRMGEYGARMVKACADRDIAAGEALSKYPAEHQDVIARCENRMGDYGWAMVKACADRDIEAEEALAGY